MGGARPPGGACLVVTGTQGLRVSPAGFRVRTLNSYRVQGRRPVTVYEKVSPRCGDDSVNSTWRKKSFISEGRGIQAMRKNSFSELHLYPLDAICDFFLPIL